MQPITTSLARRQDFIKLLTLGTILAFSLSWIASYAYGAVENKSPYFILIPVLLIVLTLGYGFRLALSARRGSKEIDALVMFDKASKAPVEIDRYSFSEDLRRIIIAITKENPAFQEILAEDLFPETEDSNQTKDTDKESNGDKESGSKSESDEFEYLAIIQADSSEAGVTMRTSALLVEAIEFALLKELSLHLSTYFNHHDHSKDPLVELTRDDIPSVLLKNRVLALLTTPIEQRPIFRKTQIHKNPPKGTVHSIWSKEGVMFERFDLILPVGSKLDRPEQGVLELTTKRGMVRLSITCHGFSANQWWSR